MKKGSIALDLELLSFLYLFLKETKVSQNLCNILVISKHNLAALYDFAEIGKVMKYTGL